MNRLTEKCKYSEPYESKYATACINKLGKLEDIEQELGCSLDVVFKAIKNGIFKKRKCFDKDKFIFVPIVLDDYGLGEISNGEIMDYFYLKDYKVTWWLKDDLTE